MATVKRVKNTARVPTNPAAPTKPAAQVKNPTKPGAVVTAKQTKAGRTIYITTRFSPEHPALDFAGLPVGTPILAPEALTVEKTGFDQSGYGNYVFARDQNNYQVRFGHFVQPSDLKAGQKITPGAVVGFLGSTGHSTGPHLHFEVRGPDTYATVETDQYLAKLGGYGILFSPGSGAVNNPLPGFSSGSRPGVPTQTAQTASIQAAAPISTLGRAAGAVGTAKNAAAAVNPVYAPVTMAAPANDPYSGFLSTYSGPTQTTAPVIQSTTGQPVSGPMAAGQPISGYSAGSPAGTTTGQAAPGAASPADVLGGVTQTLAGQKNQTGQDFLVNVLFVVGGGLILGIGMYVIVQSINRAEGKVVLKLGGLIPGGTGQAIQTLNTAKNKLEE